MPESILARACAHYRRDPDTRFFPTPGQLLKLCRDEERDARFERTPAVPAIPGPLHVEVPPHPCPVPRLAGRTEEDERLLSLEQTIGSLTQTRAEVPEEVVVSLDALRSKYPPRKIGVRKEGGGS